MNDFDVGALPVFLLTREAGTHAIRLLLLVRQLKAFQPDQRQNK